MSRIPDVFNNTNDQIDCLVNEKVGMPSFFNPKDERALDGDPDRGRPEEKKAHRTELLRIYQRP